MRKLVSVTLIATLGFFSGVAWAQSSGKYIRKQLKPDFFIPDSDLDYTEKLPSIRYNNAIQPSQDNVITKNKEVQLPNIDNNDAYNEPLQVDILNIIHEVDNDEEVITTEDEAETTIESTEEDRLDKYLEYSSVDFNSIPEYKQKYDDYMKDLDFIGETGQAPASYTLKKDLAKMNSNEKILVTDKFGIK